MMTLAEYRIRVDEIFNEAKNIRVFDPISLGLAEKRLGEVNALYDEIRKNQIELNSPIVVDRTLNILDSSTNFIKKQINAYKDVEIAVKEKQKLLDERRAANTKRMEEDEHRRKVELEAVRRKEAMERSVVPEKTKFGNPNFVKGQPNPYRKKDGE